MKKLIPLTCLLVMIVAFKSDIDPLETLAQKLVAYYARFPQEKIYVQTDKPYYLSGDNIWFRAYLVNASGHTPSTLSKKIYVELVNESDSVIKKLLLNAADLKMDGYIHLPDSLQEGNYELRAYTNWMLNFKSSYIFNKKLYIGSGIDDLDMSLAFIMNSEGTKPASADLLLRDLDKNPLPRQNGTLLFLNHGRIVKQFSFTTDNQGKANVPLAEVQGEDWNDGHVLVKYKSHVQNFYPPVAGNDVDIQFLPEGGNIVNGAESVVAFRAVNSMGKPVSIEGYVKNENNNRITNFKTFYNGMGKFSFIPSHGKEYTAVVTVGGKEVNYLLPQINDGAYQLSLIEEDEKNLKFRVALGDALYQKNVKTVLLGTSHGLLCFASSGHDMYEVKISKDSFPDGVAKFTLFDDKSMPVSERLVFIQHHNLNVGIIDDRPKYGSRAGVNLTLDLKDKNGKPLKGNFAVAVTDNGSVDIPKYGESILTRLLLTSDLKGHIDDPGYYFESNDPKAKDALDLVMLTHGWSRFTWDDITSKSYPVPKYYLDSIININGKVSMRNGQPAKQFQVILFADKWGGSDSTEHWGKGTAFTTTDDSGYFTFQNVHFTDSTQFFMQTRNNRGNDKDVKIDITQSSFPVAVGRIEADPFASDDGDKVRKYKYIYKDEILDQGRGLTLKTITIKTYKEKPNYDASRRISQTSSIVTYDQIEKVGGNVNLVNALLMVPGVGLKDGHIAIHGGRGGDPGAEPMLIVDGVQMTSPDPIVAAPPSTSDVAVGNAPASAFITALNSIPYNTIEFIEVLKETEAAIYGVRGGNGVVIVNTKREVNLPSMMTKGTKTFYLPGYHVSKEFYIPRYDLPQVRDNPKRDLRSTIYWNGNVKPDASGKAMMFFYTSDAKEGYTVVLEGITADGEIVHQTATIEKVK